MNAFRQSPDHPLDRAYIRTCACYKLMKAGKITADRAVELMTQRHVGNARNTVEIWKRDVFK